VIPRRIVSLVPSVTETLLAWGVLPVACTRFCEQPEILAVGGTKDPDVAAIVALGPDLVVMNDEENRREDVDALTAAGVRIHTVVVRTVDDVAPEMAVLADRVGLARHLELELPPVVLPPVGAPVRRAFVPIWRRPWMTLGATTYGSSLLARLGIENLGGQLVDRYGEVDLDAVAACHPDLVVAPSEPYPFAERHRAELEVLAPVVFVDGQDLFWWGARTPAAIERLTRALAPADG